MGIFILTVVRRRSSGADCQERLGVSFRDQDNGDNEVKAPRAFAVYIDKARLDEWKGIEWTVKEAA